MARPKSEDKKLALLEAVITAFVQSDAAAPTATTARNVEVAEGMLSRYFATKDDLIGELYLFLKHDFCQSMMANLDHSVTNAKIMTHYIWNSYISWGLNHTCGHCTIRQLIVSEKVSKETEQQIDDMFSELRDLCRCPARPEFMSDEYRAFDDGLFLSLAETIMGPVARDAARANEYVPMGFEVMWRALTREEQ